MGDVIGGDMDDWILATFNIPSVTNELGTDSQFSNGWVVNNAQEAFNICKDNSEWIEFVYQKMGS